MQRFARFQRLSASRGPSATAELLIATDFRVIIFGENYASRYLQAIHVATSPSATNNGSESVAAAAAAAAAAAM